MIILLGPDGTGKTTLAHKLETLGALTYYHFTKDSGYKDYVELLCKLEMTNAVLDRHALCEYAYAGAMRRPFKFKLKEWHNLITMTLIQKPLIILCTHKPFERDYPADQYLPYELWDKCLLLYRQYLMSHGISYIEYDYVKDASYTIEMILHTHQQYIADMDWWRHQWVAGYGCAGSPYPKFLLVAERLGPNNVNNIPFETGPTGQMLSDMLMNTKTPLGNLAITNMVKSFRRDDRAVNAHDKELLEEEIISLKPKKVIFMGSVSKIGGTSIALKHGCEVGFLVHLGSLNHKGITDMTGYDNEWAKTIGLVPSISYKEVH